MPSNRIGFSLISNIPVEETVPLVRLAEEKGFEAYFQHETYFNRDAISYLACLALTTKRIKLGTDCIGPYTRHPALIAMTAATLDELSKGRFILGLGTNYPMRLRQMGIDHSQPISALREAITMIRTLWRGEEVSFRGRVFKPRQMKPTFRTVSPKIPIYVAGWNPRMLELAGQLGDGFLIRPGESPRTAKLQIARVLEVGEKTWRPDQIEIVANILCCVDENAARAFETARTDYFVAYMFSVMEEEYYTVNGFDPRIKTQVAEALQRGDVREACRHISHEMLSTFMACGTPSDVAKKIREFVEAGVDLPLVQPIETERRKIKLTIEAGAAFASEA